MFPPAIRSNPNTSYLPLTAPRPLPCHATYLPGPSHSPPPAITRTPKASNFLCCQLQPLASSQSILLLYPFDALISPALKPTYLSLAPFRELRRKPASSSCSTEQKAIGQDSVIHSSKYRGEGAGRLPSPFLIHSCGHWVSGCSPFLCLFEEAGGESLEASSLTELYVIRLGLIVYSMKY